MEGWAPCFIAPVMIEQTNLVIQLLSEDQFLEADSRILSVTTFFSFEFVIHYCLSALFVNDHSKF